MAILLSVEDHHRTGTSCFGCCVLSSTREAIRRKTEGEIVIIMEEAQDDDEIFVYMGGNQQVPDGVRRARIHKSVKIVRARAFYNRRHLISVEFHDEVEIIEEIL